MNIKDWMKAEFPKLLGQECLSSACVTQRWDPHNINLAAPCALYAALLLWVRNAYTKVRLAELVGCGLDDGVLIHTRGQDFLTHHIQSSVVSVAWEVRGSNPCGGENFRTRQYRPWGPLSHPYNRHRVSFRGGNAAGGWRWPPTQIWRRS